MRFYEFLKFLAYQYVNNPVNCLLIALGAIEFDKKELKF